MGEDVKAKDVFLAFTVDQGGNVSNACQALEVEVIKCNCHRVNSATLWSLGIVGSAATCKSKAMGELMKRLAALVGVFSYSAVNNDKLKEIQRVVEDSLQEVRIRYFFFLDVVWFGLCSVVVDKGCIQEIDVI